MRKKTLRSGHAETSWRRWGSPFFSFGERLGVGCGGLFHTGRLQTAQSAWLNTRWNRLQVSAWSNERDNRNFRLDFTVFQKELFFNGLLGRTYGLKGKTPVVETSGQRQSINVISAVNAAGEFWAATYDGKLDAGPLRAVLEGFYEESEEEVFLVLDGLRFTKPEPVDYVDSLNGRFRRCMPCRLLSRPESR